MISPYYCYYNICKNSKLSEYRDTSDIIQFLQSLPQLRQTSDLHFSHDTEFKHFISVTLMFSPFNPHSQRPELPSGTDPFSYNQEEQHNFEDTGLSAGIRQTNLIVVVVSRLNNAPRYVEPILLKIAEFLNWELQKEEDKDDDEEADEDRFDFQLRKNYPGYSLANRHRNNKNDDAKK